MKKLIIFNSKMNALDLSDWSENIKFNNAEFVFCPPFVYLENFKNEKLKNLKLGAQNCFWENQGAYTGEISPIMLKNLGAEYVIIGHSERRNYLDETDEMINKKIKAALETGLKVILCVGEPDKSMFAKDFVKDQLEKDLKNIHNASIIAYEPVWAISAENGKSDAPDDALEMIKFIKQLLNTKYKLQNTRVVYGGSVDSKNIQNFLKYEEIDGALVGGASLKKDEVEKICKMKF